MGTTEGKKEVVDDAHRQRSYSVPTDVVLHNLRSVQLKPVLSHRRCRFCRCFATHQTMLTL